MDKEKYLAKLEELARRIKGVNGSSISEEAKTKKMHDEARLCGEYAFKNGLVKNVADLQRYIGFGSDINVAGEQIDINGKKRAIGILSAHAVNIELVDYILENACYLGFNADKSPDISQNSLLMTYVLTQNIEGLRILYKHHPERFANPDMYMKVITIPACYESAHFLMQKCEELTAKPQIITQAQDRRRAKNIPENYGSARKDFEKIYLNFVVSVKRSLSLIDDMTAKVRRY